MRLNDMRIYAAQIRMISFSMQMQKKRKGKMHAIKYKRISATQMCVIG